MCIQRERSRDRQINRKTVNRQIDREIERECDREIDRKRDGWIDRQKDTQINRQIDRYIHRQLDRYIDRQMDIYTHIYTHIYNVHGSLSRLRMLEILQFFAVRVKSEGRAFVSPQSTQCVCFLLAPNEVAVYKYACMQRVNMYMYVHVCVYTLYMYNVYTCTRDIYMCERLLLAPLEVAMCVRIRIYSYTYVYIYMCVCIRV